jgi:RNase H-like domain found in reverse transcriptase/Reverse transcriptase (RNA-dependent DNA polymerase)
VRSKDDVMIPAMSEVTIGATSKREGLSLISPCIRRLSDRCFAPNGLIELPPRGAEFMVQVGNLSTRPRLVRAGQVVALAESVKAVRPVSENYDTDWKEKLDLRSVPEHRRPEVILMLEKHSYMWNGQLGAIDGVSHRIETTGTPVHCQPYRAGLNSRAVIQAEIERMKKQSVIEEAEGEWASPVVLIPKPDGTVRFCVDYRRLNAITKRDVYPLPRMDDCLDSLGGATVFSTLDANSGYWQVAVKKSDRPKTAFTTHCGTYQFNRMPFGLSNAPATFQRALDVILSTVRWSSAIVYLDDVIVFSRSHEQHIVDLDRVLTLLGRAGVSLKFEKCSFFQEKVAYLGHIVSAAGFEIDQSKTAALRNCRVPTNRTELRSFLGLANVYRRFVQDFAKTARPLTLLLKKEGPETFKLDEAQMNSFCLLKDLLCSAPVLALPRQGCTYVLDTDASGGQVGCVLQQEQDGQLRPLGYWSKTLSSAEENYSTTEKEALAVVWSVRLLRPYLERERFTVRTDHSALRWMYTATDSNARVLRWRLALAEFDFSVEYRPGRVNQAADAMSRLQTRYIQGGTSEVDVPVLIVHAPTD